MMPSGRTVGELSPGEIAARLEADGLRWRVGPFVVRLRSDPLPGMARQIHRMYHHHPLARTAQEEMADLRIDLFRPRGIRRWWRPQVIFQADAPTPFQPFPWDHAFPLLEWGLNFTIAVTAQHFLMLHAGVVAKGDRALLLPGLPGSGKSTLAAALMLRGWRLLSDEFALIRIGEDHITPLPRPIAIKNRAIDALRAFAPEGVLGPLYTKTRKGVVAHLRPSLDSVLAGQQPARPAWIVSPRYLPDQRALCRQEPGERGFLRLAGNAFNYEWHGQNGFQTLIRMVRAIPCHALLFDHLEEAVAAIEQLTATDT